MKLHAVLLGALQCAMASFAQPPNADSLWSVWEDESQHDTVRLEALRKGIFARYLFSQPDSAFYYAEILFDEAERLGQKKYEAEAINIQAGSYYIRGDVPKAIPYAERYLGLLKEHWPDSKDRAHALLNLGQLYSSQGDRVKAIQCFDQSLKIAQAHDYAEAEGGALMNLGNEYETLGDLDLALEYLERALSANKESGQTAQIGVTLSNIGIAYRSKGNLDKALDYNLQALELHEKIGDAFYIASTLLELGLIYNDQAQYELSDQHLTRALDICVENDLKINMVRAHLSLGELNLNREKIILAEEHCKDAMDQALELEMFEEELNACICLYKTNKSLGNATQALEYLERSETLGDSLKQTETAKKLQRYEFDKELLADSLRQEEEKHAIELAHQEEVAEKDKTRNMLMGGGLLLLLVAGGLFSRNRYVNRSRKAIKKEKDRSEELLLNILPEEVAEELKDKGEAEAQLIDQVTVLFTDFKGFTALSEKLSPKELVDDLNLCFSEFDRITAKYGIEKIKTIGDAYMAAGGLPTPNDTHATDVIKAALEMRDFVEAGKARKIETGLPYFEIRIGVHTGPVVAGIVGVKKFQYDIWGDTVNTASRMESSGEVGQVNISEATHALVKDTPGLTFTPRGKVQAKGKGEMEMYFTERL